MNFEIRGGKVHQGWEQAWQSFYLNIVTMCGISVPDNETVIKATASPVTCRRCLRIMEKKHG